MWFIGLAGLISYVRIKKTLSEMLINNILIEPLLFKTTLMLQTTHNKSCLSDLTLLTGNWIRLDWRPESRLNIKNEL